jgi:hypothetical protein
METRSNWNHQQHEAVGLISFTVDKTDGEFSAELHEKVQQAIYDSPSWQDVPPKRSSSRWIIADPDVSGIGIRPAPLATLTMKVRIMYLTPTQLYAFYKYVGGLVMRLAEQHISGVWTIESDVVFRARGFCYDSVMKKPYTPQRSYLDRL